MTRTVLFIFLFLFAVVLAIVTKNYWLPWVKNLFGKKESCSSHFLFVGDSLTEFNESYADQLKASCPDMQFKKIAKSGVKTDWMLEQLKAELQKEEYDTIVIWGGVNDIYATGQIANAEDNLKEMYDLAKSYGAKVIALTVPPTATYTSATEKTNSLTKELNDWIKNSSRGNKIIDTYTILDNGTGGTKVAYLQPDTLHLNKAGQYEIMREFSRKILKT